MDESKKSKTFKFLKEIIPFILILDFVIIVKHFLITPIQVNGGSMDNTLKDGDIMILNKIGYKINGIHRFDIVVIDKGDSLLIKRVIGLPNETLKMENNQLYVNGEPVEEDFLEPGTKTENFTVKVRDDCYFVMGDNREVSYDSRALGCFSIDDIMGTTKLTLFPFDRIGTKN
jgi:signal peptidase I